MVSREEEEFKGQTLESGICKLQLSEVTSTSYPEIPRPRIPIVISTRAWQAPRVLVAGSCSHPVESSSLSAGFSS